MRQSMVRNQHESHDKLKTLFKSVSLYGEAITRCVDCTDQLSNSVLDLTLAGLYSAQKLISKDEISSKVRPANSDQSSGHSSLNESDSSRD